MEQKLYDKYTHILYIYIVKSHLHPSILSASDLFQWGCRLNSLIIICPCIHPSI